jgi:hypothetical protein
MSIRNIRKVSLRQPSTTSTVRPNDTTTTAFDQTLSSPRTLPEEMTRTRQMNAPWSIDEGDRIEYQTTFEAIAGEGFNQVAREEAMKIFRSTGLRSKELRFIFSLIGSPDQEVLNPVDILRCRKAGAPLPSALPPELLDLLNEFPTITPNSPTNTNLTVTSAQSSVTAAAGLSQQPPLEPSLETSITEDKDGKKAEFLKLDTRRTEAEGKAQARNETADKKSPDDAGPTAAIRQYDTSISALPVDELVDSAVREIPAVLKESADFDLPSLALPDRHT